MLASPGSGRGNRSAPTTFADLLRRRAAEQPHTTAFTWLGNGADDDPAGGVELSYAELDRRARGIGAALQHEGPVGERALLLFPPGLDFVAALFGCFYAGWIAVPAYPPPLNSDNDRVRSVARDAQPRVALTSAALLAQVKSRMGREPALEDVCWRTTDDAESPVADWRPPLGPDDVAVLQYTSGSTTAPRGVMLTHANLLHNTAQIAQRFGVASASDSRGVIWLPPYHDMGLVGGILEGVYAGFPIGLMSPVAFLQRPRRWLEAITRTRATISGGPNFAYDMCVERIPAAQRAGLDLSAWQVAFNGAETVREPTLRRFAEAFAPFGFHPSAFYPCYGLAEATLMVTGGCKSAPPVVMRRTLEADRQLVGCGRSIDDQHVLIVDPSTQAPCAPGQAGEVWLTGPSVAAGYWNQPALTDEVFGAQPSGPAQPHASLETRYLRTGDLGFLDGDGELFITGRLKAVLILGGRKIQAEDIEATLAGPEIARRPGGLVAMSVDAGGEERLVIVQDVHRKRHSAQGLEAVAKSIRARVAEAHQLPVWAVALTRPGGVPRTSSGKVRRAACREAFLNHQLQTVYEWQAPDARRLAQAHGRVEA